MRTRAIIVAAGGALALAAGVVVPASAVPEPAGEVSTATSTASSTATSAGAFAWPTHCLDAIPDSPEDYQDVFDHRRSGWAGADGAWPIALPDGRALWLFGDSFMGDIDENDALLPGWHFVRSVQVQDGACFTPMTRGTIDAPTSFFPDQDGTVFWPSGGYVDTSVSPAVLRVVSTGICIEPPDWRMCTIKIHTLSLTDFEVLSVESVPFEPAALDMPNFGAWFFQDGGEIYLYGKAGGFQRGGPTVGGPYPAGTYVARVPAGQIGDPAAWRYWEIGRAHV